jgi:methionyl-tRNA synthetase
MDDFVARVNSELVGKFINIASRSSGFLTKIFAGKLAVEINHAELLNKITAIKDDVTTLYHEREYNRAVKLIMHTVDEINLYVDNVKPWLLARDESKKDELHQTCTILINAFRYIAIYLKPIVPSLVAAIEQFLNIPELAWQDLELTLLDHTINPYSHLITRIDPKLIKELTEK